MKAVIAVVLLFLVVGMGVCAHRNAASSERRKAVHPEITPQESERITREYHERIGPPTDPRDPRYEAATRPTTLP